LGTRANTQDQFISIVYNLSKATNSEHFIQGISFGERDIFVWKEGGYQKNFTKRNKFFSYIFVTFVRVGQTLFLWGSNRVPPSPLNMALETGIVKNNVFRKCPILRTLW